MAPRTINPVHIKVLHGRRHGRRLRAGLEELLRQRLPDLTVSLPEPGQRLVPGTLFTPAPREVWLEIGFGAGEHLAWQAARNREVGLLGAEVFINGIASLLRQVETAELSNVRIFQGDARELLDSLPERSLGRVFILFPDPWPKARHHKRRLVRRETVARLAAVVRPGGEIRMATDHIGYADWMLERMTEHSAFHWLARRPCDWRGRPPDWPQSRYERKAVEQGRNPVYLRFRRRASDLPEAPPGAQKSLARRGSQA